MGCKGSGRTALGGLLNWGGLIILAGAVLFFYVWWPIQAERARVRLNQLEEQLSQKKSELQEINQRLASLTSLSHLDAWARENGPWKVPGPGEVLSLEY
ncbi:MAG: hypothetical protein LHV69_03125 [Elusimicrobia bacterium]|nr:hypothetical protein [Candidatus Obscuribacterium magneticum]